MDRRAIQQVFWGISGIRCGYSVRTIGEAANG